MVLRLPATCDRAKFLYFGRAQVGSKYGYLTILSIFFTLLTPWFIDFMRGGTWICSAVVGEALRFGGWYHEWPSVYSVAPDPLFAALVA